MWSVAFEWVVTTDLVVIAWWMYAVKGWMRTISGRCDDEFVRVQEGWKRESKLSEENHRLRIKVIRLERGWPEEGSKDGD
jgi:hypothetical protein